MKKLKSMFNLLTQIHLRSITAVVRVTCSALYELLVPLIKSPSYDILHSLFSLSNHFVTLTLLSVLLPVVLLLQTKEFFSVAIIHMLPSTWRQTTAMLLISSILEIV